MKKFWKILLITLGSILGLAIVVLCVVLWLVLTPARLTPIVNKQLPNFIEADAKIERVELTFFSSFPRFELKANGLLVKNHVEGADSDTLLDVASVRAEVDVKALLKRNELIISDLTLKNGSVYAYVDSDGQANFDIMPPSPEKEETDSGDGFTFAGMDIDSIVLDDISVTYDDNEAEMYASLDGVSAKIKGVVKGDDVDVSATLKLRSLAAKMGGETPIDAEVENFSAKIKGSLSGDAVNSASVTIDPFGLSLTYGEDVYFDGVKLGAKADIAGADLERMFVELRSFELSLNELALEAHGTAELGDSITTDLAYSLGPWKLTDIVAVIPPAFSGMLDGIDVNGGTISSEGTVRGVMKDSTQMPMMDIRLRVENGAGSYEELLPLPVNGINIDVALHTDLMDDAASYVVINEFSARTPKSSVSVEGRADKLFSDMRFKGTASVDAELAEFAPMLPDTMDVALKGRAKLALTKADVSMAQLNDMALDKMKLNGSLSLTGVDVVYDTIKLATNSTVVDLSLPNKAPTTKNTGFAGVSVRASDLYASMGGGMKAALHGGAIDVEVSDVRDKSRVPALMCKFGFDHLTGEMEGMSADVENPSGSVSLATSRRRNDAPVYGITFKSGNLAAAIDDDSYDYESIDLKANVVFNDDEEELLLRWVPRGFVDLRNANADMSSFDGLISVPVLRMDFTPREFDVSEAKIIIGESDLSLKGELTNITPYIKGDSILRGSFDLTSDFAGVGSLLSMMSADKGSEETEEDIEPVKEEQAESGSSGPFLVPDRVDLLLRTRIEDALIEEFFADTLSNLSGNIVISDGAMIIDVLSFVSPAADMQLTAIYRTPRRDHLYAYLDFHLVNVDMGRLLSIIPPLEDYMPMLKSFSGEGEFHMAVSTYLTSDYDLKMSTLRGAASIKADNLVLLDGETFTRILEEMGNKKLFKMLVFDPEKGVNIDSLSAEFTVFRDEVDVYPFLLKIDKFGFVIAGRHNTDMSFDYNISLVESPLPFRVTLNVLGTPDDMKFKLAKALYPDFYRPAYRKAVESEQANLRNVIRESLVNSMNKSQISDSQQ